MSAVREAAPVARSMLPVGDTPPLQTYAGIEERARAARTLAELLFTIANETWQLFPYRQGIVWQLDDDRARLRIVSGLARLAEDSPYTVWLKRCGRWLAQRAWSSEPARQAALQTPLQPWAARTLRAGHKKLVHSARDFARQSPQQRHALRLWVKRQRYATEFFQTLPGAAPHAQYRGHLHELQSSLGRANDAHIARSLLGGALAGDPGAGAAGQARGAGRFVLGWLARQAVEPADPGVLKALKFIRKSHPAW